MVTGVSSSDPASMVSRDQFLTLFAKQLQYQDPTSPMDTDNFLQQLAQLTTVEGIQKMGSGIDQLGPKLDTLISASATTPDMQKLQALNAGSGLLGLSVRYGNNAGDVGYVSEIKPDSGNILVKIGDSFYPISNVKGVSFDPELLSE